MLGLCPHWIRYPRAVHVRVECGVQFMGVEIASKYEGTGSNFLAACLVIEELAKVRAAPLCARVSFRHMDVLL